MTPDGGIPRRIAIDSVITSFIWFNIVHGIPTALVSPPPTGIFYQSLSCDHANNCPNWTYCDQSRVNCLPCVACGTPEDQGSHSSCKHPTRCYQLAGPQKLSEYRTCLRLAVVNGRSCRGDCQPYPVLNSGSPLGSRCQLKCDDVTSGNENNTRQRAVMTWFIGCEWRNREGKADWNDTLPDGFVQPNETTSTPYSVTSVSMPTVVQTAIPPSFDVSTIIVTTLILIAAVSVIIATVVIIRQKTCRKICEKTKLLSSKRTSKNSDSNATSNAQPHAGEHSFCEVPSEISDDEVYGQPMYPVQNDEPEALSGSYGSNSNSVDVESDINGNSSEGTWPELPQADDNNVFSDVQETLADSITYEARAHADSNDEINTGDWSPKEKLLNRYPYSSTQLN